jgi:hypothetical protein
MCLAASMLLVGGGCATQPPIQPLLVPGASAPLAHDATPLAVEPSNLAGVTPGPKPTSTPTKKPTATPKPAKKPTATPKPTQKPPGNSFYRPPGWDGYSDVDCSDFDTHAHALSFFKGTGGSRTRDPYGLDADHDGSPCESLP